MVSFKDAMAFGAAPFTGGASLLLNDDVRGGVEDIFGGGMNRSKIEPYEKQQGYLGGDPGAYERMAESARAGREQAGMGGSWAMGQAAEGGMQAQENPWLTDQESMARGYDQAGSMELMRQAAQGQAPSEAAYMLQQGLDKAANQQTAMAGGARGAAALAGAQSGAAANVANLQSNAFSQAGQLRANEMASARGAYNNAANTMRGQDQARIGQNSQMSQFNAGNTNQYRLGMGQLNNQYGQQQNQWFNSEMDPYKSQAGIDYQYADLNSRNYNDAQGLNVGKNQANADRANQNRQEIVGFVGGMAQGAPGMGGSKKPPGGH